jgi:glutamate synthase domain-containing protein 1
MPEDRVDFARPGHYGVGMVFLPRESGPREQCQSLFESVIQRGFNTSWAGATCLLTTALLAKKLGRLNPSFGKFCGTSLELESEARFERKLYVIRRRVATPD